MASAASPWLLSTWNMLPTFFRTQRQKTNEVHSDSSFDEHIKLVRMVSLATVCWHLTLNVIPSGVTANTHIASKENSPVESNCSISISNSNSNQYSRCLEVLSHVFLRQCSQTDSLKNKSLFQPLRKFHPFLLKGERGGVSVICMFAMSLKASSETEWGKISTWYSTQLPSSWGQR